MRRRHSAGAKPVARVAGDVVEIGADAATVNGQRLPSSSTAANYSLGRELSHVAWGRYVGADQRWLVSTRVLSSWDSRYLGRISMSQVRSVALPVWTVE